MARVKNELFHFLVSRRIFKGWYTTNKASKATEQRKMERNRNRLVWLALGQSTDPQTGLKRQIGKGTYIRKLHGRLKWDKQRDIS
jgi:hypothetical protein